MADGVAPVKAYLAALSGWKKTVTTKLDKRIVAAAPGVKKAVKWNSPLYGMDGESFAISLHVFTNFVRVTFFRGMSLRPMPPGASKLKDVRYFDVRETDAVDDAQFASWVTQAVALPGWRPGGSTK
ncbi:MAG: DUF1801 domain-containing protein [Kofleriaceae bacterium]